MRLIGVAGIERQLDQRRRRKRLQPPETQHPLKHLRPIPNRIADPALQLTRAHTQIPGNPTNPSARAPECHNRGTHERIELADPPQLDGSQQHRMRVSARRQRLEQRRCHIAPKNLGSIQ